MKRTEFDKFPEDLIEFDYNFTKRIQQTMKEILEGLGIGDPEANWEIEQVDRSGAKGHSVQRRVVSDHPSVPFDPSNPFEPWEPIRRRPMPRRRFEPVKDPFQNQGDTLVDILDEKNRVNVYVEVRGEDKANLQLNVTEGTVEVKGKDVYEKIDLPPCNMDVERASSTYKNGVLQVTIPKKNIVSDQVTEDED